MRKTLLFALAATLMLAACAAPPPGTPAQTQSLETTPQWPTSSQSQVPTPQSPMPDTSPELETKLTPEPTPAPSQPFRVDVFWYDYSDTYLASVRSAMEAEFAKNGGSIAVTMYDCENDQLVQSQSVKAAIAQGSDLVVVNIVTVGSEEAAMNIVNLAKSADIPIIFFNREVYDDVVNSYDKCIFIGIDYDGAGYKQGEAVAEFLLSGDNLSTYDLDDDGEIKYIMFRGEHGCAESYSRSYFSVRHANELLAGKAKLTPSLANETSTLYDDNGISNYFLYANCSKANATELMRTALTVNSLTDGSIELIIANNDEMAIGAIEAMNEVGFNTGAAGAGYIPVFGIDATAVAREAIAAGKMTATVMQDGEGMAMCIVAIALNIASGGDFKSHLEDYPKDAGADKIRIPFVIVK